MAVVLLTTVGTDGQLLHCTTEIAEGTILLPPTKGRVNREYKPQGSVAEEYL